jgi:hypothetical protein
VFGLCCYLLWASFVFGVDLFTSVSQFAVLVAAAFAVHGNIVHSRMAPMRQEGA